MAKLIQKDWFYYSVILFAVALPFSEGLVSTAMVLLIISSIIQYFKESKRLNLAFRKPLLIFSGIFFTYVAWLVFTHDIKWALYELQKNIPYLIIPLAFFIAPVLTSKRQSNILYVFSASVVLSSLFTLIQFYIRNDHSLLDAQLYGFIHHIRFSFELIFAMIILTSIFFHKRVVSKRLLKLGLVAVLVLLFVFLIWHQSLTGLISFIGTAYFAAFIFTGKIKKKRYRLMQFTLLVLLTLIPIGYVFFAVERYYTIDDVNERELVQFTKHGTRYIHDVDSQQIENGHFVWLYVCEKEMQKEWDARSEIKYQDLDQYGYQLKYTLIRYLSSKDYRKDAEGVKALSKVDIQNIESGISNYILADRGLSLYPRIYVSIWELDTYLKTGEANHKSLAQRIEYTKAALSIIKENLWMGVGTGNWKSAYAQEYKQNKVKMDASLYAGAHNQYLDYLVKFGIIGTLLILFFILYPVIEMKLYKNPVFLLFLVMMLLGNFGDSNFETHIGSNFFVFFYCLFIKSDSRLLLSTQK